MIWGVARAHRLNDADAHEVSQATWLWLFEHLGKLKEPAGVGAWFATTARRECLRVLRQNERWALYDDEAAEHEWPDRGPDEAVLLSERDLALWRSFWRLCASDRALLRLLMAEPRPSYEEISALPATVRTASAVEPARVRPGSAASESRSRSGASVARGSAGPTTSTRAMTTN